MNKKNIIILILLSLLMLVPAEIYAQAGKQKNLTTIESIVTDGKGTPLPGAIIYGNEGQIFAFSDANGRFVIAVPAETDVLVEAPGFESRLFKYGEIRNMKNLQLSASEYLYGSRDVVNTAFTKVKRGELVGSVSVIEPDEISEYDNEQSLLSALGGRITGMLGNNNIRGIGAPLYIIDGLPRDVSYLTMAEVDQVTVLKDINASMLYGSKAVNGVVLITTRRGEAYKQQVRVNGYYGVSSPLQLPEYLSSADYMELYNEARLNDGLSAPYSEETIENYRSGNRYRYPDIDYYSSAYLKAVRPFYKATTELSGGNDIARYYSNIGWSRTGSQLNFGEGKDRARNLMNIRGNVDLTINKWVKTAIDAVAVFDNSASQTGDFWGNASTYRPHLFSPLIPFELVAPEAYPLVNSRKTDVDGKYLLGGTSSYLTNAIAEGFAGGNLQTIRRNFSFNNRIDVDLNDLVQGLAFHTNVGFDLFTQYRQSIDHSYSVYEPTWSAAADSITALKKYGSDVRTGDQIVGNSWFARRFAFFGLLDYDRTFGDIHHVYGAVTAIGNHYKSQGNEQGIKDFNLGFRVGYALNKKYMADLSLAYINSVKLPENNRLALSPSLGLAWMISEEDFMSQMSFIDHLKIRASAGILNSDAGIDGFYYYDNRYSTSSGYNWYEGTYSNSGVISNYGGNMDLGFEKRKEISAGFEGSFLEQMLQIEGNVFTSQYYNQITRPSTLYPSFYSNFLPYRNYDNNAYRGAELGITVNRQFGEFTLAVGANALYATSEVLVRDEVWENDYQYRKGRPVDARYALVAEGLFRNDEEIASHALQAFGTVRPGDIKYADQNGDNIINSNDQVMVGRWQAPFSYGLNFRAGYKAFTLFALGYGRSGSENFRNSGYYWIDGDDKYSETVLGRWTTANMDNATYPRLSSLSGANNFQNSTYWMYKEDYFDIQRVQLSYEIPASVAKKLYMKRLSCFVDASNLYSISKSREIRELTTGAEPQYRSFSLGIRTLF